MRRFPSRALTLFVLALLVALPALAEDDPSAKSSSSDTTAKSSSSDSDSWSDWRFQVAPYLWLFFIDGDVGSHGKQTGVHTSLFDLFQNTDTVLGVEVNMQAQNGPWTLLVDPTWLRVTDSFDLGAGPLKVKGDITANVALIDAMVLRELWHKDFGAPVVEKGMPRQGFTLDALGGMRATIIGGDLNLKVKPPGDLLDDIKHQWDATQNWVDPVIGARATIDCGRFEFIARGDVGGFTIQSDITSEMWASAVYKFKMFGLDAGAAVGFRALYDDYDADNGFLYKTWIYGPTIGMGFRF